MKFFNADGSIRSESDEHVFGWIWKNSNKRKCVKMIIYNDDGSIKSEKYEFESRNQADTKKHNKNEESDSEGREIKTKNEVRRRKRKTWDNKKQSQNMYSSIENNYKNKLTELLMGLSSKESHLLLSIVNNAALETLEETKLRKAAFKINYLRVDSANIEMLRLLRLEKLHETFGVEFNLKFLNKRYFYDLSELKKYDHQINECNESVFVDVDGLREVLFCDRYLQPEQANTEVDLDSKEIETVESKEPSADIDKTLFKLFDKTCKMHCEVGKIRKCFLEYDNKIDILLKECKNLQEDIYETKYLDEIILNLKIKTEKVKQNWPFKLGNASTELNNTNFII